MPEHTIPESLLADIQSGKAALVVGAGIGVPSWKQLLERINERLAERGGDNDAAAAKDVEKLLKKGSLVRAAGFLSRAVGSDECDDIVAEVWNETEPTDIAKAIAKLPFREVWTTFPGDLLERAMADGSPESWPETNVATYDEAGALGRRRRTLLKVLGELGSFAVTPLSIRQRLSKADDLRKHIGKFYGSGTLLFIGFRFGDPDLAGLLDRVLGSFEPPESEHIMVASGVGPVTVDELMAEHHIEVINLAGKGADETATAALLGFLETLSESCDTAGISLADVRPEDDDLDGWLALLGEDHTDLAAREAVLNIAAKARDDGDSDRLVDALMGQVELEEGAEARAELLREVAGVFETQIGDLPKAFTALTAALAEEPSSLDTLAAAERLADDADGWTELVTDVSEIAGQVEDKELAARYWERLGYWYQAKLKHVDYAVASYRESVKRDPELTAARDGLVESLRKQQNWAELTDALAEYAELDIDPERKSDLLYQLGELHEEQLGSSSRATDAYQQSAEADPGNGAALVALERLHRAAEHWDKLAWVLEHRATLSEQQDDPQRAAAIRRELASLRAEKLGDVEGAIAKYEAALEKDPYDLDALRALEDYYARTARTDDFLRTLERLVDAVPESERFGILRRLAVEVEDRPGGRARAIEAYERMLELDPTAEDAYRALERNLRAEEDWPRLISTFERHVAAVKAAEPRAALYAEIASVCEHELGDTAGAIEAHLNAIAAVPEQRTSLGSLARLYEADEQFERAIDVLVQHAEAETKSDRSAGADLWARAGALAATAGDLDTAAKHLEKALVIDEAHAGALVSLADIEQRRGNYDNAAVRFVAAAEASGDRRGRASNLLAAADLYHGKLSDPDKALELGLKVLDVDPENRDAGRKVATQLRAAGREADALPVLEMLARTTDSGDTQERAAMLTELGALCMSQDMRQKAIKHYEAAAAADHDNRDAALGLSAALYEEAAKVDTEETWNRLEKQTGSLLARHLDGLYDEHTAQLWYRVGRATEATQRSAKAEAAYRRALEADSTHAGSLEALVRVARAREDWLSAANATRAFAEASEGEKRAELYCDLGDLYGEKLLDAHGAITAYKHAIEIDPTSYVYLHKALEVYTAKKDWLAAVETLDSLAQTAVNPNRRAKYYYAAAVIGRDELGDKAIAGEHFEKALDENFDTPKAFDALDAILTERAEWKKLARLYRRKLKQVGEDADPEMLLGLWTRLGDVCAGHLGDNESAIAAYEVAVSLDDNNAERHEQLANLYLEAGESRREDAIEELQVLLTFQPDRVEIYRLLSELYMAEGELDKAYCVAQALVFLGQANDGEQQLYDAHRPRTFSPAQRRLTDELWQRNIIHQGESRHVNAIFSQVAGSLAATTAQPPSAFNFSDDAGSFDGRPVERVFKMAAGVLGVDPEPTLRMSDQGGAGLRVANTAEDGRLSPTVLVGKEHVDKNDERELAFEVGKRLAYFKPERFVNYALQTLPRVESAFRGVLAAAGARGSDSPEATEIAQHLQATVPDAVLDQVAVVAKTMAGDPKNGLIASWRSATDLTANRVGFILCNDLETAARMVATERGGLSALSAKDRLRDLIAYSVSEEYFSIRRHLGVSVSGT